MSRIWYCVAMSLDGYIAGPHGEYDWIPDEPEIDWAAVLTKPRYPHLAAPCPECKLAFSPAHSGLKTIPTSPSSATMCLPR